MHKPKAAFSSIREQPHAASLTGYNCLIIDRSKEPGVLQHPNLLACQQVGKKRVGKKWRGGWEQTVWEGKGTEKKAD